MDLDGDAVGGLKEQGLDVMEGLNKANGLKLHLTCWHGKPQVLENGV